MDHMSKIYEHSITTTKPACKCSHEQEAARPYKVSIEFETRDDAVLALMSDEVAFVLQNIHEELVKGMNDGVEGVTTPSDTCEKLLQKLNKDMRFYEIEGLVLR